MSLFFLHLIAMQSSSNNCTSFHLPAAAPPLQLHRCLRLHPHLETSQPVSHLTQLPLLLMMTVMERQRLTLTKEEIKVENFIDLSFLLPTVLYFFALPCLPCLALVLQSVQLQSNIFQIINNTKEENLQQRKLIGIGKVSKYEGIVSLFHIKQIFF